MKLILFLIISIELSAKTLFLDKGDKGEILIKTSYITSITFDNEIKTIFLGDTENFKSEMSGDKKLLGVWVISEAVGTNLVVMTDKEQFNFEIKRNNSSPLFYYIKNKKLISKKEIIERSLIKDRDIIEKLSAQEKAKDIFLSFHDKETFKDTLYINLRLKVKYSGKETIEIMKDEIILSQNGSIMPIMFKNFDSSTMVLTLTAEAKTLNSKIRVQVGFLKGKNICVSELII